MLACISCDGACGIGSGSVQPPFCFLFQAVLGNGSLITAGAGVGASTTAGVGAITGDLSSTTGWLAKHRFVILTQAAI
jgi:hypothetical protein